MSNQNDNTAIDFKGFKDKQYEIHDAAAIFPGMRSIEFEALKEDIKENGQQVPISVYHNKVVDGRHRLRACRELGIDPQFISLEDIVGSIGAYVVSMNLHRRHLTDSQRAMIAANLATLKVGDNQHTAQAVSQGEAAKTLSVSIDSLQRGKKVRESNHPRLIEAVECGVIDVSNAFVLATLDKAELDVLTSISDPKDMLRKARAIKKQQKQDHARFLMEGRGSSTNHEFDDSIEKYDVIYADPFVDARNGDPVVQRELRMKDICAIPVKTVADDNAALFLSVPTTFLEDALKVINAWGFTYRSHAVCVMQSNSGDAYFSETHKLLIIATNGDVGPNVRPDSVIQCAVAEGSQTHDAVYRLMETMFPGQSKLQVFRHCGKREGWRVWENDKAAAPPQLAENCAPLQLDTEKEAANTEQYENAA